MNEVPSGSGGAGELPVGEGEDGVRMKTVEGADQLPPEHFEAVEGAALLAAEVEAERAPRRVRVARILGEAVEVRLPFGAAVFRAHRIGQRRVDGVVRGDPEQLAGRIVDEVR